MVRPFAFGVAVLAATQQSSSAAEPRTAMTSRIRSSAHGLATTLSQQTAHTVCRLATHQFLADHNVAVSWRDWARELACEVVVHEPLPSAPSPQAQQSLYARAVERVRDAGLQKWSLQQPATEEPTITTMPPFSFEELLSTHSASARARAWLVQFLQPQPPTPPPPTPPQFVSIEQLTRKSNFDTVSYLLLGSFIDSRYHYYGNLARIDDPCALTTYDLGFPTGPLLADRFLQSPHARALCRPEPPQQLPPFVVAKTITMCATLYTEPIRFLREFVTEYYPKAEDDDNIIDDEYEYDYSIGREELELAVENFRFDEQQASQKWRTDQVKTVQDWFATTTVSAFQTGWHCLVAGLIFLQMCIMSGLRQADQKWMAVIGMVGAIIAGGRRAAVGMSAIQLSLTFPLRVFLLLAGVVVTLVMVRLYLGGGGRWRLWQRHGPPAPAPATPQAAAVPPAAGVSVPPMTPVQDQVSFNDPLPQAAQATTETQEEARPFEAREAEEVQAMVSEEEEEQIPSADPDAKLFEELSLVLVHKAPVFQLPVPAVQVNVAGQPPVGSNRRPFTAAQQAFAQGILDTASTGEVFVSYNLLGLQSPLKCFVDQEDGIKRAYRRLSLKVHPDKTSAPAAADAFQILIWARDVCLLTNETFLLKIQQGREELLQKQREQQKQQHQQQLYVMKRTILLSVFLYIVFVYIVFMMWRQNNTK
jgi:DnaJ domain